MTKIQEKVTESAQLTDAQERAIKEESQIMQMLHHLAPWLEKTEGEELIGNWETTLATRMMIKLLELWLTEESRQRVEKMLELYHPLDRAAMAYALLVYVDRRRNRRAARSPPAAAPPCPHGRKYTRPTRRRAVFRAEV